jgi:hypothetical protein
MGIVVRPRAALYFEFNTVLVAIKAECQAVTV